VVLLKSDLARFFVKFSASRTWGFGELVNSGLDQCQQVQSGQVQVRDHRTRLENMFKHQDYQRKLKASYAINFAALS
jgi:hypothetical protein